MDGIYFLMCACLLLKPGLLEASNIRACNIISIHMFCPIFCVRVCVSHNTFIKIKEMH